ncbi:MAG: hypothetical protein WBQ14_04330 [Gaiellaceae bacterium]
MRGISNFNVTLYDLFGYLMPGLVALGSLALLAWSLFIPSHPLHSPSLTSVEWLIVFVLAYFLGHLVQAIGNLAFCWAGEDKVALEIGEEALGAKRMKELQKAAKLGDEQKLSLFSYCDTYLAQQGKTTDREIYQYREGFYRGLTIAILPALAAIVVELIRGNAAIRSGGSVHMIGIGPLVYIYVILLATVGLSYWRFRRFVEYRVRDALFGFAIDKEKPPSSKD